MNKKPLYAERETLENCKRNWRRQNEGETEEKNKGETEEEKWGRNFIEKLRNWHFIEKLTF